MTKEDKMSDEQLPAEELAKFKQALAEMGYDPSDFRVELDADADTVTVTRISNGIARTYPRGVESA